MAGADMVGWSIKETGKLIKLCIEFQKEYSKGGQGASRHLSDLSTRIENFEAILEQLKTQVKLHDSKLYINYTSIENTLKDCKTFFEKRPIYLKAPEQRSPREKFQCTVEYIHSAKDEVDQLCKKVESHYHSINAYVGLLNMKYNTQHLQQNDDLTEKVDRIDTKLNLILRQHRHYSMDEITPVIMMGPSKSSTSLTVDQAASKQLADLEIDYAILNDLRKKSATESETQALSSMISDLRSLKDRVKNLAERTGNMDAQQRKRGEPAVKHTDPGFVSYPENRFYRDTNDDHDPEEEAVEEERMLIKALDSGDSAVAFSDYKSAASTAGRASTSTEPLSPGEKPKDMFEKDEVRIEEFEDVEIDMAVGKGRKAFPCTLQVVFCNNHLTELSAKHLECSGIQLPVIIFGNNHPRTMPNILYRGQNAPIRHCVTPMGVNSAICKAIYPACAPEYKFASKEESERFQAFMLGKTLLFSANVKSIKSKYTDPESKLSVLRIWRDSPNPNDTLLSNHSLMYYYNTARKLERQRPIEISLTEFEWPPRKGFEPLELKFKECKGADKEYLRIQFLEDATKLCSYLQSLK